MDNYIGFIYFWENLHPDAKIHNKYIGQHIGKITDPYKGSGTIFLKRFYCKKYRNFWKRTILQTCQTIEELNNAEIYWIDKYNACNNDQFCNIRAGGKNALNSISTRLKISKSRKGKKAWNKGQKGVIKHSKETLEKKIQSAKKYYEPLFKQRKEYALYLIQINGSIKMKELAKHEGFSNQKAYSTIKSLVDEGFIKEYYFGSNDLRYVVSEFSLESHILQFIKETPNCLLNDIIIYIKNKFDIGKTVTKNACVSLGKQNKIKNIRGYRQNFYSIS